MKKRTIGLLAAGAVLAAAGHLAAVPDALAELAWMGGEWYGSDGPVQMEERWMEPRGGLMLGVHRDVKDGKAISYEFARIQSTPDGIVYFASPEGRPPTPFKLIESKDRRAVFANPSHDFPKRILYWLDAAGSLHARIEGDSGDKENAMEWTWKKGRFGGP